MMPKLTLPQGQSLREIAQRFDFKLESLLNFLPEHEPDTPLEAELQIHVPREFFDRKIQEKKQGFQHIQPTTGSMNPWLAMDIEQKRTRSAGGIHATESNEFEEESIEDARRSYLYFEASANELTVDLCNHLSATHAVEIRAHAFALQALAYAQRYWLFSQAPEKSKANALSAAKAATMAHPKLFESHLATAMAYRIESQEQEWDLAVEALQRALKLAPNSSWCWTEFGKMLASENKSSEAYAAAEKALECDFEYPLAHELMGVLASQEGEYNKAIECFAAAAQATPTYPNPLLRSAISYLSLGEEDKAEAFREQALERAQRERYKSSLREAFDSQTLRF